MAKKFKYLVQFAVDETWVEDGFDMTDQRALDMLSSDLIYADTNTELEARVILAPDARRVARKQGYTDPALVEKVRSEGRLHIRETDGLLAVLRAAHAALDSVAHIATEGDTDSIKSDLARWIKRLG